MYRCKWTVRSADVSILGQWCPRRIRSWQCRGIASCVWNLMHARQQQNWFEHIWTPFLCVQRVQTNAPLWIGCLSPLRSLKTCPRDGFFICWKNELDHLCSRSAAYLFHFVSVANAVLKSQDGGDVQFDRFDNTSGILYLRMIGQKLRLPLVRDLFENAL